MIKLTELEIYSQLLESNAYRHPIFIFQLEPETNTTSSKQKQEKSLAYIIEIDSANMDTPTTNKPLFSYSSLSGVSTQPISASPVYTFSRVYFNQTGTSYWYGSFKFNAANAYINSRDIALAKSASN
jgi:hypothetical protein